jgi:hypothetical protein
VSIVTLLRASHQDVWYPAQAQLFSRRFFLIPNSDFPLIIPFIMRRVKMSGPDDGLQIIQVKAKNKPKPKSSLLSFLPPSPLHLLAERMAFKHIHAMHSAVSA